MNLIDIDEVIDVVKGNPLYSWELRILGCEKYEGKVEYEDETCWYKNGKYHRLGGPAIEWIDGTKYWFKKGKLHREDGPAIEYTNSYKCWYLEGVEYSEFEWKKVSLEL